MNVRSKILYALIDGELTGGNLVCYQMICKTIRRGREVLVTSPSDGPLCRKIKQKGIPLYFINTTRTFNLLAPLKIAYILRSQNVTLVHTHESFSGTILFRIGGLLAQVPVITHAHVKSPLNPNIFVRAIQLFFSWWTSKLWCAAIIAVSDAVRKEFIQQFTDSRKIQVVYNGIEVSYFSKSDGKCIKKRLGISENDSVVLHIGRLCKTKGQDILLKAAQIVCSKYTKANFVFVGEDIATKGKYRKELEYFAQQLKIDCNIHFMGQRDDIPNILAMSDMLVLPSLAEGFPLVILEAMAASLPVIVTPVSGIPEIVKDGETGYLVPVGDVKKLAESIVTLIQNPDKAKIMGQKGFECVSKKFRLDKMLDETMRIHDKVLGPKSLLNA